MYKELGGEETKRDEEKGENQTELNRFYKKEIGEGMFEITEPYKPENEVKARVGQTSRMEVVGFDDFFGSSAENEKQPTTETEKDKIDRILGLTQTKTKAKEPKKQKPKKSKKAKKQKKQQKKETPNEPEQPKLSIFKQRMLARRHSQNN